MSNYLPAFVESHACEGVDECERVSRRSSKSGDGCASARLHPSEKLKHVEMPRLSSRGAPLEAGYDMCEMVLIFSMPTT